MAFFSNLSPTSFGLAGLMGLGRGRRNENIADRAMPYLNRIPGEAERYLSPYLQQGQQGQQEAQNVYNRMYNEAGATPDLYANHGINFNEAPEGYARMSRDPMAYINDIMRGYTPSEGYKYRENRALQEMRNAAAAGGFRGTEADRENQARTVSGILGEDMQQWLQNVMGAQGGGMAGEERRIGRLQAGLQNMLAGRERAQGRNLDYRMRALENMGRGHEMAGQRGFEAAQGLAGVNERNLGNQAGLAFQGARHQNAQRMQRRREMMQLLAGGLGMMGGMPPGGGYYGPGGAYGGGGGYGPHSAGGMVAGGY